MRHKPKDQWIRMSRPTPFDGFQPKFGHHERVTARCMADAAARCEDMLMTVVRWHHPGGSAHQARAMRFVRG